MDLVFLTYLILKLDTLQVVLCIISGSAAVTCIFGAITFLDSDDEGKRLRFKEISRKAIIVSIIGFSAVMVLPSTSTAKNMLAVYGINEAVEIVSQNEDAKRIAFKSLRAVETLLDEVNTSKKK